MIVSPDPINPGPGPPPWFRVDRTSNRAGIDRQSKSICWETESFIGSAVVFVSLLTVDLQAYGACNFFDERRQGLSDSEKVSC